MRKERLLSVLLLLIMGGFFFNSCSKDDKEKELSHNLNNTIWEGSNLNSYNGEISIEHWTFESYISSMRIEFDKDECIIDTEVTNKEALVGFRGKNIFKYTYKRPKFILTPKKENNFHKILEVTLFDNEMSVLNKKTNEVFRLKRTH